MPRTTTLSAIVWWEPVWILALGFLLVLPPGILHTNWYPWITLGLFCFWPLRWLVWAAGQMRAAAIPGVTGPNPPIGGVIRLRHIVLPPQAPITVSVLVMLGWLPVNIWVAADRTVAWPAAGLLACGMTLCVGLYNWPPARRAPALLAAGLVAGGTMVALVSIPLVAWKPEFRLFYLPIYAYLQRVSIGGDTIHANVLAGGLAITIPLLAAIVVMRATATGENATGRPKQMQWTRGVAAVALLIQLTILVLGQSRGAYLAVAISLCLVIGLRWHFIIPALLLVALGLLALVSHYGGGHWLLEALSNDGSLGGWAGRLNVWHYSAAALRDFQVTGIGIGMYTQIIPLLYPVQMNIAGYPHAHNHLLQVGLDLGLPGLIAYMSILLVVTACSLALVLRRTVRYAWTRALNGGALGALVAFLVHGLFDATLWNTRLAPMPWILFALIVTLYAAESFALDPL